MTPRLPHVREPSSGEPDVCVHCLEEWVDLLTLYETDECSVRLRAALDAERAAVVAWLREQRQYGTDELIGQGFTTVCGILADEIERGEHRRKGDE